MYLTLLRKLLILTVQVQRQPSTMACISQAEKEATMITHNLYKCDNHSRKCTLKKDTIKNLLLSRNNTINWNFLMVLGFKMIILNINLTLKGLFEL